MAKLKIVTSKEIIKQNVPVKSKDKPIKTYVVAAVRLPDEDFAQGDTILVTSHIQTSVAPDQNDDRQLTGVGIYLCDGFNDNYGYNGAQMDDLFREVVPRHGLNVDPKMHHRPFDQAMTTYLGSQFNKWVVVVVQGNVRRDGAPDSFIVIDDVLLKVTKLA